MKRVLGLFLVLLMIMLVGCTAEKPVQNTTNETPPPPLPVLNPSVTILSPADGDVIYTTDDTADVTLSVSIHDLVLKAPGGQAKQGQGHFKLTIDGGEPQIVITKNYVISGLTLGEHTIELELLNNDRTPYSPEIKKQVSFTIEREEPPEYVPKEYRVDIKDFSYEPDNLTVKVSDKVIFTNTGAYPRSATCFVEGKKVFDTGVLGPGQNATITMDKPTECEYYSLTYRAMTGTIVIEEN